MEENDTKDENARTHQHAQDRLDERIEDEVVVDPTMDDHQHDNDGYDDDAPPRRSESHEWMLPEMDNQSSSTPTTTIQGTKTKEALKIQGNGLIVEDHADALMDSGDDEPPRTLEEKRKLFEEGKEAILAEVPNNAKARFGEIYFAKWGKQVLPVLVMNPYSIPPGTHRNLWLDMFGNLKNTGRLANMTNLVYWYGSSRGTDDRYSIWVTKNLMPYEIGIKTKVDQIPAALQKKIDQGKKLKGIELQFIDALKEMKEDLAKEPHVRRGYLPQDFREVWELSSDNNGNAVVVDKPKEQTETQKRKKDADRTGQASPRQEKKRRKKAQSKKEKEDGIAGKPPGVTSDEISV